MRFDFVRRPQDNVDAAPVGSPARHAGAKVLVRKRNPAVVFFLHWILVLVGRRVATRPELLDELLPLRIGIETLKCLPLAIGDDIGYVLVQPLLIRRLAGQRTGEDGHHPDSESHLSHLPIPRLTKVYPAQSFPGAAEEWQKGPPAQCRGRSPA